MYKHIIDRADEFLSNGDYENAIITYNRFLDCESLNKYNIDYHIYTYLQLVLSHFNNGNIEEANRINTVALKLDPSNESAIYNANFFINLSSKKLRIAMISPTSLTVPPAEYGGTERVIYDLTESLVKMGHEVFLFALKGSKSSATIINYPDSFNLGPGKFLDVTDFVLESIPSEIDIIHDHSDFVSIQYKENPWKFKGIPVCRTVHCYFESYAIFENTIYPSRYVSKKVSHIKYDNVVYHGIDIDSYIFSDKKKNYILSMSSINPFKCTYDIVKIAKELDEELILAGPIGDKDYYETFIKPNLSEKIKYIGCVGGVERLKLLSEAKVLLVPMSEPTTETFGLVIPEAMVSGTPVLCTGCTATEILEGLPELLCDSFIDMKDKIRSNEFPSSFKLREYVEDRFSSDIMANNYVNKYKRVIIERSLIK